MLMRESLKSPTISVSKLLSTMVLFCNHLQKQGLRRWILYKLLPFHTQHLQVVPSDGNSLSPTVLSGCVNGTSWAQPKLTGKQTGWLLNQHGLPPYAKQLRQLQCCLLLLQQAGQPAEQHWACTPFFSWEKGNGQRSKFQTHPWGPSQQPWQQLLSEPSALLAVSAWRLCPPKKQAPMGVKTIKQQHRIIDWASSCAHRHS